MVRQVISERNPLLSVHVTGVTGRVFKGKKSFEEVIKGYNPDTLYNYGEVVYNEHGQHCNIRGWDVFNKDGVCTHTRIITSRIAEDGTLYPVRAAKVWYV